MKNTKFQNRDEGDVGKSDIEDMECNRPSVLLMGGKFRCNKGGHYPFCKSQLESRTFGVAGLMRLWPHYHSRWFVWLPLNLNNK